MKEKLYNFLEEKKLVKRKEKIAEVIHFEGATSYRTVNGIVLTKKGWIYLVISLIILLLTLIIL